MMTAVPIFVNGKAYAPDETVSWDDAIAQDGFYYNRARYLGLPPPTALLFSRDAPGYYVAMGQYHALFSQAEADIIRAELYSGER